ncbi:hypothetical protein K1719_047372, partial [Acacia pycnantha]
MWRALKLEAQFYLLLMAEEVEQKVNSWVENATNGLIRKILPLDSLDHGTRLVLANALYFKGAWAKRFDLTLTRTRSFNLLNGENVKVPFMTSEEWGGYCEVAGGMEEGQSSGMKSRKKVVLSLERNVDHGGGTLVGKILSSKSLNIPAVASMIKKTWQLNDEMEMLDLDRNQLTFLFRFRHEKDYARVLKGRPWSIQGCLLNLQFHGIPLEAFNDDNAKILGDTVGETVMYEKPKVEGRLGRGFIPCPFPIQLNDPLIPGFWIPRERKNPAWVSVKYERLQEFCYTCGCIGHKDRVCRAVRESKVDEDAGKEFGLGLVPPVFELLKMEWWFAKMAGAKLASWISGHQYLRLAGVGYRTWRLRDKAVSIYMGSLFGDDVAPSRDPPLNPDERFGLVDRVDLVGDVAGEVDMKV